MKKLVSTANLNREEWLRFRKRGIGGSDAGAVCGLNPYSSPLKVYYDKISDEISMEDNEAMKQGRDLEDYVARRFMEETGMRVRRANAIFYDEEHPYMLADADRLIIGKPAGLECKTVSPYNADQWKNGKVPVHYQLQCYHYMSVFHAEEWYISALIFGRDFIIRKLTRDETVIRNLREMEGDFWKNHVEKRVMPAPDGSEASDELILKNFQKAETGKTILLSGFKEQIERRMELSALIDKMDMEKRKIDQELKLYLGGAECAEGEGYRVTWKNISTNRMDMDRLKLEKPEIYREYLKTTQSRRLTVKAA
ncbi:MAG: YqaJ viral recombinase family protein [Blautia sp.]|nr:YqaJ viral recombinase family protein [Blautia sp.]